MEKICHVEKFQISIHDRCREISPHDVEKSEMLPNVEKFLYMTDVGNSEIFPVLFQFTLFCRQICFVAFYTLLH